MSLSNQIPKGLKSHDIERDNGSFRPPIPYVPERLDDLDPDRKVPTIKIELSNGVESRQPVWDGHGSPKNFLYHMQGMREALEDMGRFNKYEEARQKVSRAKEQVQEQKDLCDVVLKQIENTVLESDKEPLCEEEAAKHNEAIKSSRQLLLQPNKIRWRPWPPSFQRWLTSSRETAKPRGTTSSTNKPKRTRGRTSVGRSSLGSEARQWQPGMTATRSCSRRCSQTTQQSNKSFTLPCFALTPAR
jgi:uncharacterized protein YukE